MDALDAVNAVDAVAAVDAVDAVNAVDAVDSVAKHDACACHHVAQTQDTSGAGHYIGGQCGGASPLSRRSSVIF